MDIVGNPKNLKTRVLGVYEKNIKDTTDSNLKANTKIKSGEDLLTSPAHRDGKTRSTLTIWFLGGFFCLLVFSFLFVLCYNAYLVDWIIELKAKGIDNAVDYLKPLELDKVLSIIITALGTSLGFIIGYYFKEKQSGF
ncbi:TPA: hypothetical protein QIS90_001261 [Providencia rettgeri]|nr:hypothetical protein [Providencia rettgeri]